MDIKVNCVSGRISKIRPAGHNTVKLLPHIQQCVRSFINIKEAAEKGMVVSSLEGADILFKTIKKDMVLIREALQPASMNKGFSFRVYIHPTSIRDYSSFNVKDLLVCEDKAGEFIELGLSIFTIEESLEHINKISQGKISGIGLSEKVVEAFQLTDPMNKLDHIKEYFNLIQDEADSALVAIDIHKAIVIESEVSFKLV